MESDRLDIKFAILDFNKIFGFLEKLPSKSVIPFVSPKLEWPWWRDDWINKIFRLYIRGKPSIQIRNYQYQLSKKNTCSCKSFPRMIYLCLYLLVVNIVALCKLRSRGISQKNQVGLEQMLKLLMKLLIFLTMNSLSWGH